MARNFRFYVKKRGARRTDSRAFGDIARTILFAVLFFGGIGLSTYLLATSVIPEWRVNNEFEETKCLVVGKRLLPFLQADGTKTFRPEFQVLYDVNGRSYQSRAYDIAGQFSPERVEQQAIVDQFEVNRSYPCWYDPRDPATAVLVRGYTWSAWLLLLVPLSFVIAGGGGLALTLLKWGKSAERRAAYADRPIPIEMFGQAGSKQEYPTVPQRSTLTESPGTKLAYRLPVDARPLWALGMLCVVCVLVAVIALGCVVLAVGGIVSGTPEIAFTIFSVVWFLVGLIGLVYAVRRLYRETLAGPTILEISNHPLHPGLPYQLFLRQPGRGKFKQLVLKAVCEERATSQQGTNTRTELRRVAEMPIVAYENVRLSGRQPLEEHLELVLPDHAMHSFKSSHNSIEWKLFLSGVFDRGRSFERYFPIIVYPHSEARA